MSRLWPAGATEVVQVTNINKVRTHTFYQSTMSLLVIDFTYLQRLDGDTVVKELADVDFQSNRVSSYAFKRPYGKEVPMFNARMNEAIDHGCDWNDGDVLYSELETEVLREASSAVAIYCFRAQKPQFVSGFIERIDIDNTQQECPPLTDMSASRQLHVCVSQV